jgi:hypothetical protein
MIHICTASSLAWGLMLGLLLCLPGDNDLMIAAAIVNLNIYCAASCVLNAKKLR